MKLTKKLTALILVIAMMTALGSGVGAMAADTAAPQTAQVSYVNPLYADILTEADLIQPRSNMARAASDPEYLTSTSEAGAVLRQAMKQRQETCEVYLQAPEYSQQLIYEINDHALAHTGVPTEGDYLLWQYGGWSASISYYQQNSMTYMTITYTLTYYTTAQQEAQVDAAVEDLLDSLSLSGKDDYDKLLSIYDYICANVVYDYDHLDDDSYTLQYTAYGALIDGTSVCQGYAVLLYRLALETGVDSRLISGYGSGGPHGWNIAKLGSSYYDLDSTWDAGSTSYDYFLKCEANFGDHQRDEQYDTASFHAAYPMASSDYVPHDHSYSAAVTAPTCTEQGFTVYTCDICGTSYTGDDTDALGHDYQNGVCTVCGDVQLTAPTILSCYSRQQTSVKVTWSIVDNADGYELWRTTTPEDDSSWIRSKSVMSSTSNIYTNQGLTRGVTYYYKVRAFIIDENGDRICSGFSDVDYMPAAVVSSGSYSNATDAARLLWNEIKGAHGYQIWRQNADGSYSIVKTLGDKGNVLTNDQGGTTAYSNTGLTAGEDYTYKMRAFTITEDGRKVFGAYSDEITVAVMPEAPVLTVTSPRAGRAMLSWDAVNGAAGYQIWMSTQPDDGYSIIKSITDGSTAYTKYDLVSGKTYYFKLRAYVELDGKKTFGAYTDTIAITIQ